MKFEETKNPEFPYLLTFEGEEVDIFRAVVTEDISLSAEKANTDSIREWELNLSRQHPNKDFPLASANYIQIADRIKAFHERTDEMTVEIALNGLWPRFKNEFMAERKILGKKAGELALTIYQEAKKHNETKAIGHLDFEPDIDQIISEVSDSDLSQPEE